MRILNLPTTADMDLISFPPDLEVREACTPRSFLGKLFKARCAYGTRRTLGEMNDRMLTDIGLTHSGPQGPTALTPWNTAGLGW